MVYRNTLEIIGNILEVTGEYGLEGANASRLLTRANLSYKTYLGFVSKLLDTGLLKEVFLVDGTKAFILTEKGRNYLNKYGEFESVLSSIGLIEN